MKKVKLYEVPNNSRIRVLDWKDNNGNYKEYNFHHLDGAYSYCKDDNGDVIHLAAWTPVEIVK